VKYDCVIVGAGIQGLVILDHALARGLTACCVDRLPRVGDGQTLRSQFYIHRSHFYKDRDLIRRLNDTYPQWQQLIHGLGVTTRSTESYVGFVGDPHEWTQTWDLCDVPYARVRGKPAILKGSRLEHVFEFSHMLFDGRELLAKLVQRNRHCLRFGTMGDITHLDGGYRLSVGEGSLDTRKIILCAGAGTPELIRLLPTVHKVVPVQTRNCQVMAIRGHVPNSSIVVPDAKMFIAPQYDLDGSPVLLYTHGTDPVHEGGTRSVDPHRLRAQLHALDSILPALNDLTVYRTLYLAQKTESAELGKGSRPNDAFVERIADDVICVLPTKLSLAINAAERALTLLQCAPSLRHADALVGSRPYLGPSPAMRFFNEVDHV
jgi:glycine/D-amino acid oxidase-like deaminating enzyme